MQEVRGKEGTVEDGFVADVPYRYIVRKPPVFELVAATCHWHVAIGSVRVLSLIPYQKKKAIPIGMTFSLVDDIGLEPMTFRTSSGCSSQLS